MTIHESPTLSALMECYEHSITLAGSSPSAYRVAKAFCEMRWASGGLVLLGVDADGQVNGVDRDAIPGIYERFERLCGELTQLRVEIGILSVSSMEVVFLVFNPIRKHLQPLEDYRASMRHVVMA